MVLIVPLSFFKNSCPQHVALNSWEQHIHVFSASPQMSSKRSSSFRRAIANGRRTLQREILLDETGLGLYKRFVRYVAYEILPCETDRRWYFHQNRLCPPPVFIAIVTIVQVRFRRWCHGLVRHWRLFYCWSPLTQIFLKHVLPAIFCFSMCY